MKSVELKGTLRDSRGKKASKNLRAQENVPCILYGNGENKLFYAAESQFREIIYTPNVYLINLDLNGSKHKAIIQDIQFHPVTDKLVHIDFFEVSDDKKVVVNLPINTTGNSIGVKEGGKLSLDKKRIKVKAFVKDMPEIITIDITSLGMGKTIRIGELKFDKIEFVEPASMPVISIKATRAAKEAAETPAKK
ncbi:MAG TPA: 50S ribosomal protein L25/general stress protein Ctc [Bacteroidales bacterium]|jgi:large subunit ribosomal protein L25|nr:50S ribosomal protein L25/general stress protein Ctc [Bacteroidales bacterium]